MTVDQGLAALAATLGAALETAGFLPSATRLAVDEAGDIAPEGSEEHFITFAAQTRGQTATVRTILGLPAPRFVVEHRATLELVVAGADRVQAKASLAAARAAVATLPTSLPTLGGVVERFFIEAGEEEPLPPNGWRTMIVCAFRIRSGDPLGLTA